MLLADSSGMSGKSPAVTAPLDSLYTAQRGNAAPNKLAAVPASKYLVAQVIARIHSSDNIIVACLMARIILLLVCELMKTVKRIAVEVMVRIN